ncbi:n-terminal domain protein [Ichthyophthirius multifiliis]|uniref:N-terminal domain protein n=1 Tax=Ichthyophthirius multifiliis TaxID=5932 RepID=G0QQC2_ICHMU|nr:n-terminal domain protein [Ichthyophthirius multifiliis]EGR32623.1 n-terminal domain protein [Ichthyophthirius multifiliis]|eukprot:XP_004036609.1 n-terminal domain protein [Ichthyophthirius multifiliis]
MSLSKNQLPYNTSIATKEVDILFFFYVIISNYPLDTQKINETYLINIWNEAIKFFQVFNYTKHTESLVWVLECIYMMTLKFSLKAPLNNKSFKKDLTKISKSLLLDLSNIAVFKYKFVNIDIIGNYNIDNLFQIVSPYSPNIYKIFKQNQKDQILFLSGENENINYEQITSILCYKILNEVSMELLQNIYNNDFATIYSITQEYMIDLFKVIGQKQQNQLYAFYASQLIYSLLKNNKQNLIKELKKNILDIFNSQDFFQCDVQNLCYWKLIIDTVSDQDDLFKEFTARDNIFNILINKGIENQHKIKKLFRICFIIYSGQQDKYNKKLQEIFEIINEIIKNIDTSANLIILILLYFRIMILRMSQIVLVDFFRTIWPILLNLLIKIFSKKDNSLININLIFAGLKLIELISIVQIEDFYFYQWIFLFDTFGVNIEKIQQDQYIIQNNQFVTPFQFNPILGTLFEQPYKIDYISTMKKEDIQQSFEKTTRKVIFTESSVFFCYITFIYLFLNLKQLDLNVLIVIIKNT